jgi:hypothetical protein
MNCGVRIMVLPQPSKLMTRVRFPYSAPKTNNWKIK